MAMNPVVLLALLPWVGLVYFAYVNWCRCIAWPRVQGRVIGHLPSGAEQSNDLLVVQARVPGGPPVEARIALDDSKSLASYPIGSACEVVVNPRQPRALNFPRRRSALVWSVTAAVLYPVVILGLVYAVRG
jgi:hypothetical protein